jgi:hypothetical protein
MDTFYAGNIFTGDAGGINRFDDTTLTGSLNDGNFPLNNFYVQGDIHNIISANSIGTLTLNNAPFPFNVPYKTGFQLRVGGRVGAIFQDDSFLGQALIVDDPRTVSASGPQHEIEARGQDLTTLDGGDLDPSYFDPFFFGSDISLGGTTADIRFNNDTFATAQYLGSANSAALQSKTGIDLLGALRTFGIASTAAGTVTDSDNVDYYAISLLAGQSIDVQLINLSISDPRATNLQPRLAVFDPDGRLIATNYSKFNDSQRQGAAMRIKADRPGAYRIAIADYGDVNFNGTADAGEFPLPTPRPTLRYDLQVRNVGDVALGGLIANIHIATMDQNAATGQLDRGIEVVNGDIGAIRAGIAANGVNAGFIFSFSLPWKVDAGNFRSMEATTFGILSPTGNFSETGPDLEVARGTIGLLKTYGLTTGMMINDNRTQADAAGRVYPGANSDLSLTSPALAAGLDIQVVDCAGTFEGDLLANRAIGVIRAARIGGILSNNAGIGGIIASPVIQANVDKRGNDGVIDLIDISGNANVTGDLNSAAIMTGPGGNLRYLRVVGTAYRDAFFGSPSTADQTQYNPGVQAVLTDDSGTRVTLTPLPHDPITQFPKPPNNGSGFLDPPFLTVLTYPIRGTSGKAIVRVSVTSVDDTTDGVVRPGGGGLQVDAVASGGNGSAEIGEVQLGVPPTAGAGFTAETSTGNGFTFNPFLGSNAGIAARSFGPVAAPAAPAQPTRDLNVIFQGNATIDVWNINPAAAVTNITNIINNTVGGEIVNILGVGIPNVFNLVADSVGIAKAHTGAAVIGTGFGTPTPNTIDNTYPFVQQRNLIRVLSVGTISARRSVGNILATGNVGTITANSDGVDVPHVFEGIAAPIVVRGGGTNTTGNLVRVNIGEGVLPSGTGAVGFSGIYVTNGIIDSVVGNRADIRGDIVAGGTAFTFTTQQATDINGNLLSNFDGTPLFVSSPRYVINNVSLTNGSIIDADIMNAQVAESEETTTTFTPLLFTFGNGIDNPIFDIGSVTVNGIGGIIGGVIAGRNVGPIASVNGFGIFNSKVVADGGSVLQSVTADGYGIRGSYFSSGTTNAINARGNGALATATGFSGSVRASENGTFDPYSGRFLDKFNDLHKALGTSKTRARLASVSVTGVIEDTQFLGQRNLGSLTAQQIRAKNTTRFNPLLGADERLTFDNVDYPMRLSYAGGLGNITVRDQISGLAATGGSMGTLSVKNGIISSKFDISGAVTSIQAGILRSSAAFNVTGPEGRIGSIFTRDTLYSSFDVALDIGSIHVTTQLGSKHIETGRDIPSLVVDGSILTGATIMVHRNLGLFVGKNVAAGSLVKAQKINPQQIKGQIAGDIVVTGAPFE